jgi:tetratricopeptide (TPR) repeat protein
LALMPDSAEAWTGRGNALYERKSFDDASAAYDKAIKLKKEHAEAWLGRGHIMTECKRYDEALAAYDQALALKPDLAEAWLGRGNVFVRLELFDDASAAYDNALALKSDLVGAWIGRGNVSSECERYDDAFTAYDKALALEPNLAPAWLGHGNVSYRLKRYEEAVAAYRNALAFKPDLAEAWLGRGNAFHELDRFDEALASYNEALALKPDLAEPRCGRGNVLHALERSDEALAAYDMALALKPDLAEAWFGRGVSLFARNRDVEALLCFDKALSFGDFAEAYFNKSLVKLALGEYLEGWQLYEWRWRTRRLTSPNRNFTQRLWLGDGGSLSGKTILIYAEQGFGDAIQFSRYVSLLNVDDCRVMFEAPKSLVPLFEDQWDRIELVVQGDGLPHFDVQCPLMSLPLAFRTTLETIPAATPYLRTRDNKKMTWQRALGKKTKPRIGLAWSGSANFAHDVRRSIHLEKLLPIVTDLVEWYSLQKEVRDYDREYLTKTPAIKDLSELLGDFSDVAALIAEMDLVISVDTAVAHLAGALGKSVWILLPFHSDFRWLRDREDSPWYRTARLFRQGKDGEWTEVVDRVCEQLKLAFA